MSFALAQPLAVMQCRAGRVHRQRECHLYFARPVTFLSCADMGVVTAGEGPLRDIVVAERAGAMNELRLPSPKV